MDVISFSEAATANSRIESFIENPDSTSGIVTVPKTIASGETVTIPAGRIAVLPNVQVDGVINIEGEVFVPSGATFGDLESQIAVKADTSYVNTQLDLKQNVLVANDLAVKTALNATGEAPIYACRAWVNFNGTGTVAIRASGNVSSITDNGVGDYTVNFTTAMPDVNYSMCSNGRWTNGGGFQLAFGLKELTDLLTTSVRIRGSNPSAMTGVFDSDFSSVHIFR